MMMMLMVIRYNEFVFVCFCFEEGMLTTKVYNICLLMI